jgi:FtsP/CotA-like multicopper oxidase with cupredoxin domain
MRRLFNITYVFQKKYVLIFFAVTTLAFFSCIEEEKRSVDKPKEEPQEIGNPYNILNISPKTEYNISIVDGKIDLVRSAKTSVYQYETGLPGGMIIVPSGQLLKFHAVNSIAQLLKFHAGNYIAQNTSIHWHGLRVPNDQDMKDLNAGASADFQFTLDMTGTHWYHPHMRPILDQLNAGLYAPFIVKEDYDSKYAGDYVLTLDDWTIDPIKGNIDFDVGGSHGFSEVVGLVETVNKRTGSNIYPVDLKKGEIIKLRFINASTAQSHTLSMDEHTFRVTHLDGHKLIEPYTTNRIKIAPGERVDAELKGIKSEGTYYIKNERSYGMRIPVIYKGDGVDMVSPFVPGSSEAFTIAPGYTLDKEYVLNSTEERSGDGSHGSHQSGGNNEDDPPPIYFTINGKYYVDGDMSSIDIFECNVNQVYILRFRNDDTGMVEHISRHPIHLHGGHFQVVSLNGQPPERETWKDTMVIPPGEYIDVAVKFQYPGDWMLHCHIIDHEDNGMLTIIHAE